MPSKFSILAAVAMMAPMALADYYIFIGQQQEETDGGGGTTLIQNESWFLNNPPDCNNFLNSTPLGKDVDNDASSGGVAMDGNDPNANIRDWDLTRFEFYNGANCDAVGCGLGPVITNPSSHITLYKQDDGTYGIQATQDDGSSVNVGTCTKDTSQDIGPCAGDIQFSSAIRYFHCTTSDTVNSDWSGN